MAIMFDELLAREVLEWEHKEVNGGSFDQIVPSEYPREDHITMCMLRAFIDTGITYPRNMRLAVTILRCSPEVVRTGFQQALEQEPHPDWFKLQAKFTEYRLQQPVNG